jgi:hypothetical protein
MGGHLAMTRYPGLCICGEGLLLVARCPLHMIVLCPVPHSASNGMHSQHTQSTESCGICCSHRPPSVSVAVSLKFARTLGGVWVMGQERLDRGLGCIPPIQRWILVKLRHALDCHSLRGALLERITFVTAELGNWRHKAHFVDTSAASVPSQSTCICHCCTIWEPCFFGQ